MYVFATVLIFIVCILLILIVLVQNSKGGGLASNFSAGNQFGGVAQTNKFLDRATWGLAIGLIVLSIVASMSISRGTVDTRESLLKNQVNNAVDFNTPPSIPTEIITTDSTK